MGRVEGRPGRPWRLLAAVPVPVPMEVLAEPKGERVLGVACREGGLWANCWAKPSSAMSRVVMNTWG